MKIGKLLLAVLIVSPVASCAGSMGVAAFTMGLSAGGDMPAPSVGGFLFVTFFASMFSFFVVAAALLFIALPLTLLLTKLGAQPLVRDAVLAVLGGGAGFLFMPNASELWVFDRLIGLGYGLLTAGLWIAALRYLGRPTVPAPPQHIWS